MLQVMGLFAVGAVPKISRGSAILTSPSVSRMARSLSGIALLPSDWGQASSKLPTEASLVL
jgi:hypothetical protein